MSENHSSFGDPSSREMENHIRQICREMEELGNQEQMDMDLCASLENLSTIICVYRDQAASDSVFVMLTEQCISLLETINYESGLATLVMRTLASITEQLVPGPHIFVQCKGVNFLVNVLNHNVAMASNREFVEEFVRCLSSVLCTAQADIRNHVPQLVAQLLHVLPTMNGIVQSRCLGCVSNLLELATPNLLGQLQPHIEQLCSLLQERWGIALSSIVRDPLSPLPQREQEFIILIMECLCRTVERLFVTPTTIQKNYKLLSKVCSQFVGIMKATEKMTEHGRNLREIVCSPFLSLYYISPAQTVQLICSSKMFETVCSTILSLLNATSDSSKSTTQAIVKGFHTGKASGFPLLSNELHALQLIEFLMCVVPVAPNTSDIYNVTLPQVTWQLEDEDHVLTNATSISVDVEQEYQANRSQGKWKALISRPLPTKKNSTAGTTPEAKMWPTRCPIITGFIHTRSNLALTDCTCFPAVRVPEMKKKGLMAKMSQVITSRFTKRSRRTRVHDTFNRQDDAEEGQRNSNFPQSRTNEHDVFADGINFSLHVEDASSNSLGGDSDVDADDSRGRTPANREDGRLVESSSEQQSASQLQHAGLRSQGQHSPRLSGPPRRHIIQSTSYETDASDSSGSVDVEDTDAEDSDITESDREASVTSPLPRIATVPRGPHPPTQGRRSVAFHPLGLVVDGNDNRIQHSISSEMQSQNGTTSSPAVGRMSLRSTDGQAGPNYTGLQHFLSGGFELDTPLSGAQLLARQSSDIRMSQPIAEAGQGAPHRTPFPPRIQRVSDPFLRSTHPSNTPSTRREYNQRGSTTAAPSLDSLNNPDRSNVQNRRNEDDDALSDHSNNDNNISTTSVDENAHNTATTLTATDREQGHRTPPGAPSQSSSSSEDGESQHPPAQRLILPQERLLHDNDRVVSGRFNCCVVALPRPSRRVVPLTAMETGDDNETIAAAEAKREAKIQKKATAEAKKNERKRLVKEKKMKRDADRKEEMRIKNLKLPRIDKEKGINSAVITDARDALIRKPCAREAFLRDNVIQVLSSSCLPTIISIIRLTVHSCIARHSAVLLLRCVSLLQDFYRKEKNYPSAVAGILTKSSTSSQGNNVLSAVCSLLAYACNAEVETLVYPLVNAAMKPTAVYARHSHSGRMHAGQLGSFGNLSYGFPASQWYSIQGEILFICTEIVLSLLKDVAITAALDPTDISTLGKVQDFCYRVSVHAEVMLSKANRLSTMRAESESHSRLSLLQNRETEEPGRDACPCHPREQKLLQDLINILAKARSAAKINREIIVVKFNNDSLNSSTVDMPKKQPSPVISPLVTSRVSWPVEPSTPIAKKRKQQQQLQEDQQHKPCDERVPRKEDEIVQTATNPLVHRPRDEETLEERIKSKISASALLQQARNITFEEYENKNGYRTESFGSFSLSQAAPHDYSGLYCPTPCRSPLTGRKDTEDGQHASSDAWRIHNTLPSSCDAHILVRLAQYLSDIKVPMETVFQREHTFLSCVVREIQRRLNLHEVHSNAFSAAEVDALVQLSQRISDFINDSVGMDSFEKLEKVPVYNTQIFFRFRGQTPSLYSTLHQRLGKPMTVNLFYALKRRSRKALAVSSTPAEKQRQSEAAQDHHANDSDAEHRSSATRTSTHTPVPPGATVSGSPAVWPQSLSASTVPSSPAAGNVHSSTTQFTPTTAPSGGTPSATTTQKTGLPQRVPQHKKKERVLKLTTDEATYILQDVMIPRLSSFPVSIMPTVSLEQLANSIARDLVKMYPDIDKEILRGKRSDAHQSPMARTDERSQFGDTQASPRLESPTNLNNSSSARRSSGSRGANTSPMRMSGLRASVPLRDGADQRQRRTSSRGLSPDDDGTAAEQHPNDLSNRERRLRRTSRLESDEPEEAPQHHQHSTTTSPSAQLSAEDPQQGAESEEAVARGDNELDGLRGNRHSATPSSPTSVTPGRRFSGAPNTPFSSSVHRVRRQSVRFVHETTPASSQRAVAPISSRIIFFMDTQPATLLKKELTVMDAMLLYSEKLESMRELMRSSKVLTLKDIHSIKTNLEITPSICFAILADVQPVPLRHVSDSSANAHSPSFVEDSMCSLSKRDGNVVLKYLRSPTYVYHQMRNDSRIAPFDVALRLLNTVGAVLNVCKDTRVAESQRRLQKALLYEFIPHPLAFAVPSFMYLLMRDLVAGDFRSVLPSYALYSYPQIFPFDLRHSLFDLLKNSHTTLFRDQQPDDARPRRPTAQNVIGLEWFQPGANGSTHTGQKVKIEMKREAVLKRGLFELQRHATLPLIFDVHFDKEEGVGLGPTLEFYNLLSRELCVQSVGIWKLQRDPVTSKIPHYAEDSLYPRWEPNTIMMKRRFCVIGMLISRIMFEGRVVNMRLHPLFWRAVLGESLMHDARHNLELLDPELARSLHAMETMTSEELEDCELTFTVSLDSPCGAAITVELYPGSENVLVTSTNLQEYLYLVHKHYLVDVLKAPVDGFVFGISFLMNPAHLRLFSAEELRGIINGPQGKLWETREEFAKVVVADHGYEFTSPVVQNLIDVVVSWDAPTQRQFIKFISGSECIPSTGLDPAITVVRRDADVQYPEIVDEGIAEAVEHAAVVEIMPDDFGISPRSELSTGDFASSDLTSNSSATALASTDNTDQTSTAAYSPVAGLRSSASGAFSLGMASFSRSEYGYSLPTVNTCFHYLKLPNYQNREQLEEKLRLAITEGQGQFLLS